MVRIMAGVACCDPLGAQRATDGHGPQQEAQQHPHRPVTIPHESGRPAAQHTAQQGRNPGASGVQVVGATVLRTGDPSRFRCTDSRRADGNATVCVTRKDCDVERRRARALAILAERPEFRCAVVCDAGDPAHVIVAIRGVGCGELEIPADHYDAFALLALMDQHAAHSSNAVH